MTLTFIIALVVLGLILIFLELFVSTGFVMGLLGAGIWIYAIVRTYQEYGMTAGNLMFGGLVAILTIGIVWAVKSGIWKKVSLNENNLGRVNEFQLENLKTGDKGKAISVLRPSGKAIFGDEIYEVVSRGEFIPSDSDVEIIAVRDKKIIVKKAE